MKDAAVPFVATLPPREPGGSGAEGEVPEARGEGTPTHSELHRRVHALVVEHLDFVWRSLRRLGVAEADCDDGCQRVWIVIAAKVAAIEPDKARSFVFSVVVRVASDLRKSQRPERHEELAESMHPAPAGDPERLLDQRRGLEVLDALLAELPWEQRTVFVMFELEGMSSLEIAEVLGVRRGTVASRLRLARQAFRREVERRRAQQRTAARGAERARLWGWWFMGDPKRLLETDTDDVRELLAQAAVDVAPATVRAHVLGSVRQVVAELAAQGGAALGAAKAPAAGKLAFSINELTFTIKTGALLAAVVGVGGVFVERSRTLEASSASAAPLVTAQSAPEPDERAAPRAALPSSATAPPLPSAPEPLAEAAPVMKPAPVPRAAPVVEATAAPRAPAPRATPKTEREGEAPRARSAATAAAPSDDLAEQLELLEAVRGRLDVGDAERARALLAEYERRFPRGALAPEARVLARRAQRLEP